MVFEREKVKIHILLVDDDARLQTNVRDFLEPYGCRITSMRSGEGVEAAVKKQKPDIVLLDVMLPDDDGFVVLRRLRGVSDLPVIMLTARGNDADRIVGLEMGADDYLPKPFNPRELLARIKAVPYQGRAASCVGAARCRDAGTSPGYAGGGLHSSGSEAAAA